MAEIENIRLMGSCGAVEVHLRVGGVWRLAIRDRCGDTETCDHFVNPEHAEEWPRSSWDDVAGTKSVPWSEARIEDMHILDAAGCTIHLDLLNVGHKITFDAGCLARKIQAQGHLRRDRRSDHQHRY